MVEEPNGLVYEPQGPCHRANELYLRAKVFYSSAKDPICTNKTNEPYYTHKRAFFLSGQKRPKIQVRGQYLMAPHLKIPRIVPNSLPEGLFARLLYVCTYVCMYVCMYMYV